MYESLNKANFFEEWLEMKGKEDLFERLDVKKDVIAFGSIHETMNGSIFISIIIDESMYNHVQYTLLEIYDLSKRGEILNLLNNMNLDNIILKYSLNRKNCIVVQFCYMADEMGFSPDILLSNVMSAYSYIKTNIYPQIIRIIEG